MKKCQTCQVKAKEGSRYCGRCGNKIRRAMNTSGYLTPKVETSYSSQPKNDLLTEYVAQVF